MNFQNLRNYKKLDHFFVVIFFEIVFSFLFNQRHKMHTMPSLENDYATSRYEKGQPNIRYKLLVNPLLFIFEIIC